MSSEISNDLAAWRRWLGWEQLLYELAWETFGLACSLPPPLSFGACELTSLDVSQPSTVCFLWLSQQDAVCAANPDSKPQFILSLESWSTRVVYTMGGWIACIHPIGGGTFFQCRSLPPCALQQEKTASVRGEVPLLVEWNRGSQPP